MRKRTELLMKKISDLKSKAYILEEELESIRKKCKHKKTQPTGMKEFKVCLNCGKILYFLLGKIN